MCALGIPDDFEIFDTPIQPVELRSKEGYDFEIFNIKRAGFKMILSLGPNTPPDEQIEQINSKINEYRGCNGHFHWIKFDQHSELFFKVT